MTRPAETLVEEKKQFENEKKQLEEKYLLLLKDATNKTEKII